MKEDKAIEVEGNTVEEAIKKALQQLQLPRKKVKVEIVSEEARGLFGMPGAKLARVRVSIIKQCSTGHKL
ncbi:MAG: Jag N-terminal domain-containing protein [Candidatus Omnitrophota bacterium]|jgi:spoIIIJ-associated protein